MAFTLNDLTLDTKHGLATATLHESQGKQNRVAHVIVPIAKASRLTAAMRTKQAKALMKDALQEAAKAL
jgi:hypothetical protein